jgi:hypothetical protein
LLFWLWHLRFFTSITFVALVQNFGSVLSAFASRQQFPASRKDIFIAEPDVVSYSFCRASMVMPADMTVIIRMRGMIFYVCKVSSLMPVHKLLHYHFQHNTSTSSFHFVPFTVIHELDNAAMTLPVCFISYTRFH